MSFFADTLQNVANAAHAIGIATPELGLTEGTGGVSKNQAVTYKVSDSGNPLSVAPGSSGLKTITYDGKTYDANGNLMTPAAGGSTSGGGSGTGTGTGTGGSYVPTAADYAKNIRVTQTGYQDAALQSALDLKNKQQNDLEKFLSTLQGSQDTINSGETNNALNLRRSMSKIAGGIRTGLKSGGVQLANMNATDSGAADAMARAYATMGNQQVGDANNEAALTENDLATQQKNLNRTKDETLGGFDREREAEVQRIKGDLRTKLALLDATGSAQGVNGVVDMSIVDNVINNAVAELQNVDAIRNSRLPQIKGLSKEEVNQKAAQMDALGSEGTSPFTAGTEGVNLVTPDTTVGAPISQLPLYTRKEDTAEPIDPTTGLPYIKKDTSQLVTA